MAFIEYPPPSNLPDGPFVRGRRYHVLQEARSYSGHLTAGEILTYFGPYIGIYDGVYVYAFTNGQGQERTWLRRFEEPEADWSRIFAAVPDAGEPADAVDRPASRR